MTTLAMQQQSINEAKNTLEEQRQRLQQAKKNIPKVMKRDISSQLQNKSFFLSGKVSSTIAQQKQAQQKATSEISGAESQLNVFGSNIQQAEQEVQSAQREESEWKQAQLLISRGQEYIASNVPSLMGKIRTLWNEGYVSDDKIIANRNKADAQIKQLKELEKQGFNPVYVKGQLTGFEDTVTKQSVPIQSLGLQLEKTRTPVQIEALRGAGVIEVKKIETPTGLFSSSNEQAPQINPITGAPYTDVRSLTKEESFFYGIKASKAYQGFEKVWEPFKLLGTGFGGLAAAAPAVILKPFFNIGRRDDDTSLVSGKIYRGGLMGVKTAAVFSNPVTGTLGTLYFGGEAVSSFSKDPLGFIQGMGQYSGVTPWLINAFTKSKASYSQSEPFEFVGGLAGAKGGKIAGETSFLGKKPIQITPTLKMENAVQPFSRQRATVLLKTSSGDYLLGKTKSGEIISIGGGIEKGQTARVAALAELKQETGLTLKDISGFKSAGKVVFPEETFKLFTATLNKGVKIKAASDIKSIVKVSPSNLFLRGATGQTAFQPISRYVPFKGRVRAYEAGIINFMETGVKPTWLLAETKGGSFVLGTQSRYNVPYKSQKQYLKQEELLLAHGTTQPAILKRWSPFNKKFKIEASETKRGLAQGLYVQPPISPKGRIVTSFKKVRVSPEEYANVLSQIGEIKFNIAKAKKQAIKYRLMNKELTKTYAGVYSRNYGKKPTLSIVDPLLNKESTITLAHELIHHKTPSILLDSPLEALPYKLRPSEIIAYGLEKRYAKIGFKVIKKIKENEQMGYIGLSYLNIGKSKSSGLGLKIAYPKRTAYIFRESPKKIASTPKTFSGIESEFIIPPESVVSTSARAEVFSIGLKKVYIQPSKIGEAITDGTTSKTIASISSEGQYKYITPGEIVSPLIKTSSSQQVTKESKVYLTKSYSKTLEPSRSIVAEIRKTKEKPSQFKEYKEPIIGESKYSPYRTPKYPEPIKPYKYPPYNPPKRPPTVPKFMKQGRGKKKLFKPTKSRKLFKPTKYVPSVGASILRLTARKVPKALMGKTSYAPGFRPVITKGEGKKIWKKKLSLKI